MRARRRPVKVVWVVHCANDSGKPPLEGFTSLKDARAYADWVRRTHPEDGAISIHRYVRS